ncbi:MAG: hypothetical protein ABI135_07660 [Rhodoferax sp.]
MPITRAAVWLDHHDAHVLQVNATQTLDHQIPQRIHFTRHHDSQVRSAHAFFGEIAMALAGIAKILVVGPLLEHAAFRTYLEKYHPSVCAQIVGWQTQEHSTEHEVIRLTREHFNKAAAAEPRFA